ncbi:HNH endonuclease [Pseudomonas syringae]|nr:HNH endonuclease [Pseudomonas syringae]MBD8801938.1 HNH endonuclease [Pseudomonas syringae]MBD8811712.1 HNH endonuclease [Pseudomonas syringae]
MEFYWVNVGTTHKEVSDEKFLWAPVSSIQANGKERALIHWENVGRVKLGDMIFCCKDKEIYAIAMAKNDAYEAKRPDSRSFKAWSNKGNRVDVQIVELRRPILRDEVFAAFIAGLDGDASPSIFTRVGTLNQIYMSHLSHRVGKYLLEGIDEIAEFDDLLITNGSDRKVAKTTREAIIQARVGQGQFRTSLLTVWNGRCALTGIENRDLLVASHIEPWCLADNASRLSPDNGLLLATHIDRLFDRGFISFADDGALLISPKLTEYELAVFSLDKFKGISKLSLGNRYYLKKHRESFGFAC